MYSISDNKISKMILIIFFSAVVDRKFGIKVTFCILGVLEFVYTDRNLNEGGEGGKFSSTYN